MAVIVPIKEINNNTKKLKSVYIAMNASYQFKFCTELDVSQQKLAKTMSVSFMSAVNGKKRILSLYGYKRKDRKKYLKKH